MEGLEFYVFEDELWCKTTSGKNFIVDETKTEIVKYMLEKIRNRYPEAYSALESIYQSSSPNQPYYQYLLMRCPMRGECPYEGVICMPKFNSNLSAAELRVMEQLYRGKSEQEAAKELFSSPNTVHQHVKSVYVKLGIHRLADFIQYANRNNLFNKLR